MCSCQRTGPGLSCLGMQPRAIDAGKIRFMQVDSGLTPALLRQKRYGGHFPACSEKMVGVNGVEPLTPRLSSACSNQLSYTPIWNFKFQILRFKIQKLVELRRLELLTYSLQSYRSTN